MTANTQSQAIVRVVDDDPDVRRSWQFVIEGEGWNVLTYASASRRTVPSRRGAWCLTCACRG